jgi:hypothetical protein
MEIEEHICSSCGHLSPAEWDRCHICSEELPVGDTQQIESITSYYNALDAGYGQFAVIGYSFIFVVPLILPILTIAATPNYSSIFGPSGDTEPLRAAFLFFGVILISAQITGAVLLAGSYKAINGNVIDETKAPALSKVCKSGVIKLVVVAIIVGVLSIIPLINSIVAFLIWIGILASPLIIYRRRNQWKTTRQKTILPLVDLYLGLESIHRAIPEKEFTDNQRTTAGILVLKVLSAAPPFRITDSERDALAGLLRSDTEMAHTLVESSPFADAVETVCTEANQSQREDIKEQLLELSESLKSEDQFETAQTCADVADHLVDQFDLADQNTEKTTELESSTDSATGRYSPGTDDDDPSEGNSQSELQSQEPDTASTDDDPFTVPQLHPEPTDTVPDTSDVGTDDKYDIDDDPEGFRSREDAIEMAWIKARRLLLEDFRRVRDEIGRVPTRSKYREYGIVPLSTFIRHFDSWEAVVSSIDSDQQTPIRNDATTNEAHSTDKTVSEDHSTNKTVSGGHSTDDHLEEFNSVEETLETAGCRVRKVLLNDFKRVRDEVGGVPTRSEYREHGIVPLSTLIRHFDSWEAVVWSTDSKQPSSNSNGTKREKLIAELQRLDDGTNLFPYGNKVGTRGKYTFTEYTDEFSSWEAALNAAGIDIESRLLDELRRVRDKIGELPAQSNIREHSRVSTSTYARYLGSWSEAKSRIDPVSVEPSPEPEPKSEPNAPDPDSLSVVGEQGQDATDEGPVDNEKESRANEDRADDTEEDEPQTGDDDLDALFDELDDMT